MAKLGDIVDYVSREFALADFSDASLNGLQVEGRESITKIVAAVDCGLSVVEEAVARKADLLLVHHGVFWGKPFAIQGSWRKLFRVCLENELSVLALHLPLDAHPLHGNNALLIKHLGLHRPEAAIPYGGRPIAWIGDNTAGDSLDSFIRRLADLPGAKPSSFCTLAYGPEVPKRVCILSGSGADALEHFEKANFDTLISGEPKHFAYHFCKSNRLNAIFAGHYATETLGVESLARALADRFSLSWEFIDDPSGI